MNTKKFLFYLLAAVLCGCVPVASLHCLYTDADVVFEEKLLGTWMDDPNDPDSTWQFSRMDDPNNSYKLIFTDEEGRKGSFISRLVKLKKKLFLDVYPSGLPWEPEDPNDIDYNTFFLIPAHTFLKVDSIEPRLKMSITQEGEMEKLLKENPDAVKHTSVEDRLVLTASTKQLQAFVLKYADDERLFCNEITLVCVKPGM
jgi:hypothetical protein